MSGPQQGTVFIRKVSNEATSASIEIEIQYADVSVEEATCAATMVWPSTSQVHSAFMHDKVFEKGKTKEVYWVHF